MSSSLDAIRHSCAHLLAAAVAQLFPEAKRAIGPATDTGFYYDFDFGDVSVSRTDLPRIDAKMREILPTWQAFAQEFLDAKDARSLFPDNPYKRELIDEFSKGGKPISFYTSGTFRDVCRGGHTPHPARDLTHFALLSVAGAYWRGSEKNPMLTRIYGTCFPTKRELDAHLRVLQEAKTRDHRKIGHDLDLFTFSELVGKGLPLWTPKGSVIRRELERFILDEEIQRGYLHVSTPDIARVELYKTSGHYPYYKDTMYAPITIDEEQFMLRPMTCPHHFELYRARPRSYRELPMRLAELAKLYRYEKSGELTGLVRVRGFCLADAHIITPREKAEEEIHGVLDLIEYAASVFTLSRGVHYRYRLSLGNRADEKKYFKDDAAWDFAEGVLRRVLKKRKAEYFEADDEAAFYGPKIDVQMKNISGKEETAFTVQYDFVMPKRFHLSFIDETGTPQEPVVIHRSSIGAIERTIAFLTEHFNGHFPLWLAPVQVVLLPIAQRHADYAHTLARTLRSKRIRCDVDERHETLQARIRDATLQRVPYIGIIGDAEQQSGAHMLLSVRKQTGELLGKQSLSEFSKFLQHEIEKRR